MIAEKMKPYVKNNSAIRMMFEEGNRLRAIYGADKVYDFSLGNPSVPAPECVKEAIIDLVNEVEPTVLHGYMSNDTESGRGSDRFCTILSGIWCICAQF